MLIDSADRPDRLIFCRTTSTTPPRPSNNPSHCLSRNAFAKQRHGREGRQDRLQPDDKGHQPCRHAEMNRAEYPHQITAVQQSARNRDVRHLPRRIRPRRAKQDRDRQHERHDQRKAQEEESDRWRIGQTKLGGNEAGAPKEDEYERHRPHPGAVPGRLGDLAATVFLFFLQIRYL